MFFTPFSGEAFRGLDVPLLRAFVSGAQEKCNRIPALLEIDPVTGTVVDSQLTDAFAHRAHVASISKCESIQTGRDQRACPLDP